MAAKAVFLDRDGVINIDKGYTHKPEDLQFFPGVPEALKLLQDAGYLLIVVTNQSGVARGYYSLVDVDKFHATMRDQLNQAGVTLDEIYVCPHYATGKVPEYSVACECRKPGTKLIEDAVARFGIDRELSFLVGDKTSDVECAVNAGVRGIHVVESKAARHKGAVYAAKDLAEAVSKILS